MRLKDCVLAGLWLFLASTAGAAEPLQLPHRLEGKAEVLASTDPDYARADLPSAVKPEGEGGISQGIVARLTQDIPVWRLWSGPEKKDSRGNTNRIGQWWGYDPARGSQQEYRTRFEICLPWNDLTWVAKCTLKKGTVVAIGPGNSVSAMVCGDPTGQEAYPANPDDWQIWLSRAWTRTGADKELDCPAETEDYEANPANIAMKKPAKKPAKKPVKKPASAP